MFFWIKSAGPSKIKKRTYQYLSFTSFLNKKSKACLANIFLIITGFLNISVLLLSQPSSNHPTNTAKYTSLQFINNNILCTWTHKEQPKCLIKYLNFRN